MGQALPVISLFSGAGGLDLAVERCVDGSTEATRQDGPLRVAVATDYDEVALTTLRLNLPNTPTVCADIRETQTQELLELGGLARGDAALVVGGPPCTPFSKSGFWIAEKRESRDPNASLLDEYVRVVAEARPQGFILENVQGLTYATHRVQFARLLSSLRELGYNPQWRVLLAAEYGVPQLRRRVFVVGRRDGRPFHFPRTTHSGVSERHNSVDLSKRPFRTAKEAIGDLLPGTAEPNELVEGEYGELAAEVPPGQNYLWHTDRYGGQTVFRWRSRYWTFLLRLDPERPATTLQAQPGPWVGPFHWENVENADGRARARRLRIPEMSRLMTFPRDFRFFGDRTAIQRQIGNAVPIQLGRVVVAALLEQLGLLERDDDEAAYQLEFAS